MDRSSNSTIVILFLLHSLLSLNALLSVFLYLFFHRTNLRNLITYTSLLIDFVLHCEISFKRHLYIVNSGAGKLTRVLWVEFGWHMLVCKSVRAKLANQILRQPVL